MLVVQASLTFQMLHIWFKNELSGLLQESLHSIRDWCSRFSKLIFARVQLSVMLHFFKRVIVLQSRLIVASGGLPWMNPMLLKKILKSKTIIRKVKFEIIVNYSYSCKCNRSHEDHFAYFILVSQSSKKWLDCESNKRENGKHESNPNLRNSQLPAYCWNKGHQRSQSW